MDSKLSQNLTKECFGKTENLNCNDQQIRQENLGPKEEVTRPTESTLEESKAAAKQSHPNRTQRNEESREEQELLSSLVPLATMLNVKNDISGNKELKRNEEKEPKLTCQFGSGPEKNSAMDDEALSPQQETILMEKMELEKLLALTKRLQQQADKFLNKEDTETNQNESNGATSRRLDVKISKSSGNDDGRTRDIDPDKNILRLNQADVSNISEKSSAKQNSVASEDIKDERQFRRTSEAEDEPRFDGITDQPITTPDNNQFSIQSNIRQLEENAELLQKKLDLEVLLQRARVLLEKAELTELTNPPSEDLSLVDSSEISPNAQRTISAKVEMEREIEEKDYEDSDENKLKQLYEKADEITHNAKLMLDALHETKEPRSHETPVENPEQPPSKLNSAEDFALQEARNASILTKENAGNGNQLVEPATPDVSEQVDGSELVRELEQLEGRLDLHRLLQKANSLLEKASRRRWSEDYDDIDSAKACESTSLKENEEVTEITPVQTLHLKFDEAIRKIIPEQTTVSNALPVDKIVTENKIAASDTAIRTEVAGQQPQSMNEEMNTFNDTMPWHLIQSTLRREKDKLDLLLAQTQQLQETADAILNRKHSPHSEVESSESVPLPLELDNEEKSPDDKAEKEIESALNVMRLLYNNIDKGVNEEQQPLSHQLNTADDQTVTNDGEISVDNEADEESSEEDDSSFDARFELKQLLQRARLLIEKSKVPLSERELLSEADQSSSVKLVNEAQLVDCDPVNMNKLSEPETLEETSIKPELLVLECEKVSESQKSEQCNITQSGVNITPSKVQNVPDSDLEELPCDAQLELLLQKTKLLKLQADVLISQINEPETSSEQENSAIEKLPNLQEESKQQINNEYSGKVKCPTEINLSNVAMDRNLSLQEKNPATTTHIEIQDYQSEFEEIEESQLQIKEIENLQFDIEDYLSDDSETSNMVMYYEGMESSEEEIEDKAPEKDRNQMLQATDRAERIGLLDQKDETPILQEIRESDKESLKEKSQMQSEEIGIIFSVKESENPQQAKDLLQGNEHQDQSREIEKAEELCGLPTDKLHSDERTQLQVLSEGSGLLLEKDNLTSMANEIHSTSDLRLPEAKLVPKRTENLSANGEITQLQYKSNDTAQLEKTTLSSELSEKLTQLKMEVTSLLQNKSALEETNAPEPDDQKSTDTEETQETSPNVNSVLEQPKIMSDTSCSGLSRPTPTEDVATAISLKDTIASEAEATADTGTGVPEAMVRTEADKAEPDAEQKKFCSLTKCTLLLKLQKEMAKMQLQMSYLQDAMRATNTTLQELMDEAFSEM